MAQESNASFVTQLHQDALGRTPETAGRQGWTGALADGSLTQAQVAVDIATSPEAQGDLAATFQAGVFVPDASDAAVARLYYGLLGRAPDAAGLQNWENAVAGGASLTQVAQDFILSPEFQNSSDGQLGAGYVTGLYQSALGRTTDPGGLQGWERAIGTVALFPAGVAEAPSLPPISRPTRAGRALPATSKRSAKRRLAPRRLQTWEGRAR